MRINRTATAIFGILSLLLAAFAQTDPDLSTFTGTTEKITSCSLVIPMDESQGTDSEFNLKSYGLINYLLYNNIPVKWVMRSGKIKVNSQSGILEDADFTANVTQVLPTAADEMSKNFKAGAFVIPSISCQGTQCISSDDVLPIIQAYGNNVVVYRLNEPVDMEVRYTLAKRPLIGLLNDGGMAYVHRAILLEAGFVECQSSSCQDCPPASTQTCHFYIMSPNATLSSPSSSCTSTWADAGFRPGYPAAVPYVAAVRSFVLSGGNLFAEGGAISTYEMCDPVDQTLPICSNQFPDQVPQYFMTSHGLQVLKATDGASNNITYLHADTPLEQFNGQWQRNPSGSVPQYRLYKSSAVTSTLINNAFHHIGMDNTESLISSQAKIGNGTGSDVFYLAGSNYCNVTTTYTAGDCSQSKIGNMIAGVRLFLNAMLVPANRGQECGLDVAIASNHTATCGCSMIKDSSNPPLCCQQSEMDKCNICFGDGSSCSTSSNGGSSHSSTDSATGSSSGNAHPSSSPKPSGAAGTTGRDVGDNQVSAAERSQSSLSVFTILAVALMLAL